MKSISRSVSMSWLSTHGAASHHPRAARTITPLILPELLVDQPEDPSQPRQVRHPTTPPQREAVALAPEQVTVLLRWPLPTNPKEEHLEGQRLTTYLWRGSDDPDPTFSSPE
jgi:hypothetical protein